MTEHTIILEHKEQIGVVTLNRPVKKNAFDEAMFSDLERVTADLQQHLPRVIVITGSGAAAFSAGFDVNPENRLVADFLQVMESHDAEPARRLITRIRKAVDGFVALPVPIIAAINGLAYGGGAELAVRCDLRVMDRTAEICFSEVRLGLMPDWGGGASLAKLIGSAAATDLILTARIIHAEEALSIGLVNRLAPQGEALKEALIIAGKIAENGPRAVKHALQVIRNSRDLGLQAALKLEAETAASLLTTGECLVGVAAFLERKKPQFKD